MTMIPLTLNEFCSDPLLIELFLLIFLTSVEATLNKFKRLQILVHLHCSFTSDFLVSSCRNSHRMTFIAETKSGYRCFRPYC